MGFLLDLDFLRGALLVCVMANLLLAVYNGRWLARISRLATAADMARRAVDARIARQATATMQLSQATNRLWGELADRLGLDIKTFSDTVRPLLEEYGMTCSREARLRLCDEITQSFEQGELQIMGLPDNIMSNFPIEKVASDAAKFFAGGVIERMRGQVQKGL